MCQPAHGLGRRVKEKYWLAVLTSRPVEIIAAGFRRE